MKIIYRFSDKGYPKRKLPSVNNESCLKNFIKNFLNDDLSDLTLMLDNCTDDTFNHFLGILNTYSTQAIIFRTSAGNAGSYNLALDYAIQKFSDNEIVYFVEGDFIHDVGSRKILEEGYNLLGAEVDYVTLYAHPDKEFPENVKEEYVFRSASSYWRTCVSTVMTHSAKVKTLKEDVSIIKKWTSGKHPDDHQMFTELRQRGRLLISPMPGYSTHGETDWLSPLKDWEKILRESIV